MPVDPAVRDHQTWLGYLQPEGLVVSAAALVDAQVLLPRDPLELQEEFLGFTDTWEPDDADASMAIANLQDFLLHFLKWPEECVAGLTPERPLPEALLVSLTDLEETLVPSLAFVDPRPKDPVVPWFLLVQEVPSCKDFDTPYSGIL
jgi:hypothetical protein